MDKDLSQRIQALPAEKREQLAKLLKQKQAHAATHYDVVILGGGLAGGTLAQQLNGHNQRSKILVIEKRKHPVPEAAHKVGESSVEMGSHYLRNIVGAKEHLNTVQLPKSGLRFFFPAGDNRDITQRVELGCTSVLPVPTHQIDRGRFETRFTTKIATLAPKFGMRPACKASSLAPMNIPSPFCAMTRSSP